MPLHLVTGPANAAKAGVVLGAYRAAIDRDPILVVPTLADVERYRRELAEDGVVFGAQVMRFAWLLGEIARRAGLRERAVGALTRERVAATAVAGTTLRRLAAAAATPGFPKALVRLVTELEQSRIDPGRWTAALRRWAPEGDPRHETAEELAALYGAYRRVLERLGRRDADLLGAAALDALRLAPQRWGGTPVLVYGFDDLTPLQLDAIDTLANHARADVTCALTFEPGREATAARARTHQDLLALGATEEALGPEDAHYAPASRAALHHVERHLLVVDAPRADLDPAHPAVRTLAGGGERAEAELVAGHVARLVAREGYAPEEIAVVHRGLKDAAPLLEQVLRGYGIPIAIDRRIAAGHTALGRGLVALLRCATQPDVATADDLLTWLRTPGLLHVAAFADELEADCRRTGVRTAAAARELWEADHWPLDALDRVAAAASHGPQALCGRLATETSGLLSAPWEREAPVLQGDEVVDARVAARLRQALGELARLPPWLLPDAPALARTLADLEIDLGDPPGAGRVAVVTPLQLRARRVRALFLMGLQEGVFPAPGTPEPFLGDAERAELNAVAGLRLRLHEDRLGAERHLLYLTVSRPTDLLVLSWHEADDEGAPLVRSLFVDDVCDLFAGDLAGAPERRPLGASGWEAAAPTPREAARAAATAAAPRNEEPIAPLRDDAVLASLRERGTWSASGLERWTSCPVAWFVERMLDPEALVPDPEPMVRGQLAHKVLEDALRGLAADGGRLEPARLPQARRLLHDALREHATRYAISVNPERLRAAVRRLEVDLVAFLEHAAKQGSSFAPSRFELTFGGRGDELPALELFDGELRLQGRIDRLDLGPGGTSAIVYDYKGRTAPTNADRWVPDGKLQIALYMLAVEHVLGLRAAGGFYQPINADAPDARGVVREDEDPGLRTVRGHRKPGEEVDAILAACTEAARDAVREIRAGRLEPRDATCDWQGGCKFPSICRCEASDR